MTRAEKAIRYCKLQVQYRSPYVWGGQGQKLKNKSGGLALNIARMEDSVRNAGRVMEFIKKHLDDGTLNVKRARIFDCSGLQICALNFAGLSIPDMTAASLMDRFPHMARSSAQDGDLVFRVKNGRAYHVGMLADDCSVVLHCKGRDDGCVATAFDDSWHVVARPPY